MGIVSLTTPVVGLASGDPNERIIGTKTSGPRGIEAVLEYNGLFMNIRSWIDTYLVTHIAGFDDADLRDSRQDNPGRHGETPFNAFYSGRTIVLTGKIVTKTIWKLRDMQTALRQAFADVSTERPLVIRTNDVSTDLQIWCKKSAKIEMADEQTTDTGFERPFQITLRASNPRFTGFLQRYNHQSTPPSTNLVTNPSAEVDTTDVAAYGSSSTPPVQSGVARVGATGFQMGALDVAANTNQLLYWLPHVVLPTTLDPAQPITVGASVRIDNNAGAPLASFKARVRCYNSSGVFIGSVTTSASIRPQTASGDWEDFLYTIHGSDLVDGTVEISLEAGMATGAVGGNYTVYVDGLLLSLDWIPPTTYLDGDTDGAVWLGTPGLSESRLDHTYSFTIVNLGNFEAQPAIHLWGPIGAGSILRNNDNQQSIVISQTIPVGAHWVIDIEKPSFYDFSDPSSLKFQYLDVASAWQHLVPSPNVNHIDAEFVGEGATSAVDYFWRDTSM